MRCPCCVGRSSASQRTRACRVEGVEVRNLARNDIPERVAMQMTRHKTESVYRRYAIADDRYLRVAVERLEAATGTAL